MFYYMIQRFYCSIDQSRSKNNPVYSIWINEFDTLTTGHENLKKNPLVYFWGSFQIQCSAWFGEILTQYMSHHTNKTCITVNEFDEFIEWTRSPISSSSHGQSWIKIFVAIYETWQWKCMSNFLDESTSTTVYKKGKVISYEMMVNLKI